MFRKIHNRIDVNRTNADYRTDREETIVKIMIYGCGNNSKNIMTNHLNDEKKILGFIDKYYRGDFFGIPVYNLAELDNDIVLSVDYILVTLSDYETCVNINTEMISLGFPENKLVYLFCEQSEYVKRIIHDNDDFKKIHSISTSLFDWYCVDPRRINTLRNAYDAIDEDHIFEDGVCTSLFGADCPKTS